MLKKTTWKYDITSTKITIVVMLSNQTIIKQFLNHYFSTEYKIRTGISLGQ